MISDQELLDAWLHDTPLFYTKLEKHLEGENHSICEGILKFHKNLTNQKCNTSEIIGFANSISLEKESSVLILFFLLHWLLFDRHHGRSTDELSVIFNKANHFINESTPKVLVAEYLLQRGSLLENSIRLFEEGVSLLLMGSYRYKTVITIFLDFLSRVGQLRDAKKEYLESISENILDMFSYADSLENGLVEKAVSLREKILVKKTPVPNRLKLFFKESDLILNFYLYEKNSDVKSFWAKSTKALLDKNAAEALLFARMYEESEFQGKDQDPFFCQLTLLRAELSNSNLNAASLILGEGSRDRVKYKFEDFFFARLELLKNNPRKAAYHFWKFMKVVKEYDAMARMDLELELALELKPKQIRFLMDSVANVSFDEKYEESLVLTNFNEVKDTGANRIKGRSLIAKNLREEIAKCATSDILVLILGETGVGKDVVANALHEESSRKDEPFIAINCSAIAESLLQSELFGHEVGAYTGAIKAHKGVFEEAGSGTVFLDEIGDIGSLMQIALLRVLESGEFRPIGSSRPKKLHCRIIAATNANLEEKVEAGLFRADLLYRLKRLVLFVPPLRDRGTDILLLAEYFLSLNKVQKEDIHMSDSLREALMKYSFPGNIRELKNEIEKMRFFNSDKKDYDLIDAPFLSKLSKRSVKEVSSETVVERAALPARQNKPTVQDVLQNSTFPMRRLQVLRDLFLAHKMFTRKELHQLMGSSNLTVGRDLKKLCAEGFILKVEPTKSPPTHYFILNEDTP